MSHQENSIESIEFEEVSRDFRTEIPNIVFELLKLKYISHFAFVLYSIYRRTAGEHGKCWKSIRTLAEECGFSAHKVHDARLELEKKIDILGNRSLILVQKGDHKKNETDRVLIKDIWRDNHSYFNKQKNTCSPQKHPCSPQKHPCSPQERKNEQSKKEPFEEESIKPLVHNSPPPKPKPSSTGSIPFQRKDFPIDLSNTELIELLEMEPQYSPYFRPEIVTRWLKKYGASLVLETVKFFFKVKSKQKKSIPKPEAWMEKALKDQYTEIDKLCQENKAFAENLKKEHNLRSLKINSRYCIDESTGKDYYYHLPTAEFRYNLRKQCLGSNNE